MSSNYNRPGVNTQDRTAWNSTYTTVSANSASWVGGGGSAGLWVSGYDKSNNDKLKEKLFYALYHGPVKNPTK